MVDYHRMGNMEGRLGNTTPTTSLHQLHWWKSPRWTVIRIEALTVVAIIFSFFLAAFGSCRRWSNSWIVQKGFFAAQVLSLSLGTYSIGLMQSTSVKSEMYPVWTVSLFILFGCIDPVTTYNGLDYKGPLSKMVYGICLNCGYVLLMSISTISNVVGNAAIITLSAITFIKSFHRSFAFVEQKKLCNMGDIDFSNEADIFRDRVPSEEDEDEDEPRQLRSCYEMWVALCLSHKLRGYFLGLDYHVPEFGTSLSDELDFKWALKIIEIELAFVYDALFTGNPFLHHYQAKTASLWALASFAGIFFVMVATALPGEMTRRSAAAVCTEVVGTTTVDLAITFGILVSLALLQLTQLVHSWTSNWARASNFCAYMGTDEEDIRLLNSRWMESREFKLSGWMKLKMFVATSTNMFDKYLWQDKVGQYSILPERKNEGISSSKAKGEKRGRAEMFGLHYIWQVIWELLSSNANKRGGVKLDEDEEASIPESISPSSEIDGEGIPRRSGHWIQTLGLHYIWEVIWELLSSDTNKRGGVKLDEDVKGSVIDFLGQIDETPEEDGHYLNWSDWLSSLPEEPQIRHFLPQFSAPHQLLRPEDHYCRYMSCVMTWHIATWYCEQKSKETDDLMSKQAEAPICLDEQAGGGEGTKTRDHRHVANALSKYYIYLVKSAPELLPGPVAWTKRVYDRFAREAKEWEDTNTIHGNISNRIVYKHWSADEVDDTHVVDYRVSNGKALAKLLMHGRSSDVLWKTLATVWVQLLVYSAPYGNVEAHMRHLSQGGEFITHLWALLYHLDIRQWKLSEANNLHDISTVEDAKRILSNDYHRGGSQDDLRRDYHRLGRQGDIIVLFSESNGIRMYRDTFVTASKLVDGVDFCLTSSLDVAKCLYFPEDIVLEYTWFHIFFLNKADKKTTFYDTQLNGSYYHPWDVAQFAYDNKLASAKARAQGTAGPSTSHNPIPIEKQTRITLQRLEDGQSVVEIEEETPPPS